VVPTPADVLIRVFSDLLPLSWFLIHSSNGQNKICVPGKVQLMQIPQEGERIPGKEENQMNGFKPGPYKGNPEKFPNLETPDTQ
jgi:hypothetical protein